VAPRPAGAD